MRNVKPSVGAVRPRVELWLGVAVLVLNLAVAGMIAHKLAGNRELIEEQAHVLTRDFALLLDQSISDSTRSIDLGLQAIADELEHRLAYDASHGPDFHGLLLRHQQRLRETASISVTDATGAVLWRAGVMAGERTHYGDRRFFQLHRERNDSALQIGRPLVGRVTGNWIIPFTRSYRYPDGRFAGVIAAAVPVEFFSALIPDLKLGPNSVVVLRYEDLSLIARYPRFEGPGGAIGSATVSPELRALVTSGARSGTYHAQQTTDGLERINAFRRVKNAPFIVIAGVGAEDYLAVWRQGVANSFVVMAFFLSVTAGGAWLLGRGWRRQLRSEQALRASEARFRNLAELSSDWYWEQDAQFRFTYLAGNLTEHTGISVEAHLGKTRWEMAAPNLDEADWKGHRADLEAHRPFRDFVMQRPPTGGTAHWVSISGDPIFDDAGAFLGYRGVGKDITERKNFELALDAQRRELMLVTDSVPAGIAHVGADEIYRYANARYLENIDRRTEEVIGRSLCEVLGEENYRDIQPYVRQALAGEPVSFERTYIADAASTRHLSVSYVPDREHDATVRGFFVFILDVTEEKNARRALVEGDARYRAVVENTRDGFFVLDSDFRLIDVNEAYLQRSGYKREELMGKPLQDINAVDDVATLRGRVQRIRERGFESFETRHRTRDGGNWPVDVSVYYLDHDGGMYLTFVRDISERKLLEAARLQSHKMESLGTLAGGVAHNFNNIVMAIAGNARLALEDLDQTHPARASVEEIAKASARATELVRRILNFSRPDTQPPRGSTDMREVLREVLALLRPTVSAAIEFRTRFSDVLPHVAASAAEVHESVVNLVNNAVYAIGARSGAIDFALDAIELAPAQAALIGSAPGRYCRLTISDDGCGMDEATRARIFDAFYTTKGMGQGTGLGLNVVRGIMQGVHGGIAVESELGKGTSFLLYFPAVDAAVAAGADASPAPARGRGRILLVDDEDALVNMASRMLQRLGYEVIGCVDAGEALARFAADPQHFDALVTDRAMPRLSGLDLARAVRATRPDLPVILISGYLDAADEQRAHEIGVCEIILKSEVVSELGAALERVLRDDASVQA